MHPPHRRIPRALLRVASCFISTTLLASAGEAQSRTLTVCTPDALAVCADLRLTAGPSIFEIALRTVGSRTQPLLPVSVYNLVLSTGASAVASPVSSLLPPVAEGGAVIHDSSAWEVFDTGDLVFLSALSNRGVGGCVTGSDVGGFGQAATTCGTGRLIRFSFAPTRAFDVSSFTISDLEAVGLGAGLPAASCGAPGSKCVILADSLVPEPTSLLLVATGLAALLGRRRRRTSE